MPDTALAAATPVTAKRRYIRRRNGVYGPLKITLTAHELLELQTMARKLGRDSPHKLAAELLGKVIADRLYSAVLDDQ